MNRLDLPFQADGTAFLSERYAALLADEPGLGKTYQAIRACIEVGAWNILVICPAVAVEVWRREFLACMGIMRLNPINKKDAKPAISTYVPVVNIISYDRAAKEDMLKMLLSVKWDVLICDEGHYLKKSTTARTKAVYGFGKRKGLVHAAKRTWILTGTPSPNNPYELWPHVKGLFLDRFKMRDGRPMTSESFKNKYCIVKSNGFGEQIVGARNLPELKQRLQPYVLRRNKDDVLHDLPEIFESLLYVDAHNALAEWKELAKLDEMIGLSARIVGAKDEKAREAVLASIDDTVKRRLRRLLGLAKVPSIISWIKDQLESGTDKLVVFAYHQDVIKQLFKAFPTRAVVISGETSPGARVSAVKAFQEGPARLFIGQIQAAGTAITLTAASTLLFAEYSWVPGENEQARDRIRRIGQKDTCFVRYATLSNSLDERILAVIRRKMTDIRQIFN